MSGWRKWLLIVAVLPAFVAAYALIGISVWWMLDRAPPARLVYQSPFLDAPAVERTDTIGHEIEEVEGGSRVYLYRELCITGRASAGEAMPVWVADGVQWSAPQRTWMVRPGCWGRSYLVDVPVFSSDRVYEYRLAVEWQNNPLVRSRLELPPVRLKILARGGR